jgi:uncharacterized protein (TIGR03083 family)
MNLKQMAREERGEFAAFLATLSPEQWNAPTLCTGWRVRDVVAHVISYDELSMRDVLRRFGRNRLDLDRVNADALAYLADRSPDELLALLEAHVNPRGLPAAFGGMVALVDGLIHHQDIRRPLGLPREIPPVRLQQTLRSALLAPPTGAFWRTRGLRLAPTDLDWASGRGPEVRGPGESILMAMAGRPDALDELSGPGLSTLAKRVPSAG